MESAFLGKSDVPLMTLISEQRLNGTFPLTRSTDDRSDCSLPDKNLAAGTVDVELFWQSAYIRPSLTPSKPIPLKVSVFVAHEVIFAFLGLCLNKMNVDVALLCMASA